MRKLTVIFSLVLTLIAHNALAQESPQPEAIAEKMAFKLVRGVANVTTSVVEIPKQSYLMVRDRGGVGYVVGPIKGMAMAFYRLFAGVAETVLFAVPQPGYYDSMIAPEYVWQGWDEKRVERRRECEVPEKKGE